MACVSHARDRVIFAVRMRSVGKQARDESGKYPVNEDDEEKCQARFLLRIFTCIAAQPAKDVEGSRDRSSTVIASEAKQ